MMASVIMELGCESWMSCMPAIESGMPSSDFVDDLSAGVTLGLLYERWRQGKMLTLELLAEVTSGFMFTAHV
jgi:hypothetical protein